MQSPCHRIVMNIKPIQILCFSTKIESPKSKMNTENCSSLHQLNSSHEKKKQPSSPWHLEEASLTCRTVNGKESMMLFFEASRMTTMTSAVLVPRTFA